MSKVNGEDIKKEYGYLKIGNQYFEMKSSKDGRWNPKEVGKKKLSAKIKKAKKMATTLQKGVDTKKYHSKRKYKPKTREHACVDMKVGNFILPIVN